MLPYRDSRITTIVIVIFFVLVLGYAYFEARGLLYGPRINVSTPTTEVHDPFIDIKGTADRIATLSMNGASVSVTENGAFDEPYLLSPGLNRITLDATDKYGHHASRTVLIVYTPLATASSSPEAATSSPAATPVASSTAP